MTGPVVQRCGVCGRFRAYEPDDRFCVVCGAEALAAQCVCGRGFAFALDEPGDLFCPRCGRGLRGRPEGFEA